jgi:hypothetical protein
MEPESLAAFLAVLATAPLWILLTHGALSRLCPRTPVQFVAVAAGLVGAGPTTILVCTLASLCPRSVFERPVEGLYGAIVYACVAYSYFHLFNMSETARRIRILSELYSAGSLSAGQLSSLYDGTAVLEMRLDRLLATRQLARRTDRFVTVGCGLYAAARLTRAWRLVLGFEGVKPPRAGS